MRGWCFILLGMAAPLAAQTITGTLVNGVTGEPLPGIAVALASRVLVTRSVPLNAKTDSAGVFRFESVDPGDYIVLASHPGFEAPPFSNTTVHVESGKDPAALRLTLMPWPTLSGHVFDRQRRPVAKASVTAIPTHGSTPWPATTDSEGRFTFKSLQPARYTLLASPPESAKDDLAPTYYPDARDRSGGQPVTALAGPDLNGLEITLRAGPFFKISGRVVDEHGDPAAGTSVRVRNTDTLFAKVTADADGRFEIEGI